MRTRGLGRCPVSPRAGRSKSGRLWNSTKRCRLVGAPPRGARCVPSRTTRRDRCKAGRCGQRAASPAPYAARGDNANHQRKRASATIHCVTSAETTARDAIERAFSEDYGRLYAGLVRQFRDFDLVEDALQEAMATAMTDWALTASRQHHRLARHRGASQGPRHTEAPRPADDAAARRWTTRWRPKTTGWTMTWRSAAMTSDDDLLRLIFTCCHPALNAGSAGRADPAHARAASNTSARPRLRRAGGDDGPAPGAGQAQDPRRRHPVEVPPRETCRSASRRAGRYLPHLQRGLRGQRRRRAAPPTVARGHPSGPGARRSAPDEPEVTGLLALMLLNDSTATRPRVG